MDFAICFLAYGNEHINEFNIICNSLLTLNANLNIFVCTNDVSKINNKNINIIETAKQFNYNLKRESIKFALKKFDTILCMDTDMVLRNNIDFSIIDNLLEDGLYLTQSPYRVFRYRGQLVSSYGILNNTNYGKLLKEYANTNDLYFSDEQIFVLKIKDKSKKENFINHWDYIFDNFQPIELNEYGMYEGLNIYTSAKLSELSIHLPNTNLNTFFKSFSHYGWDVKKTNTKNLI
jgi:hypothetical protein